MKTNNTASKDHCCRICNKNFTLKRNVTKHLKVVHNQIQKSDDKNGLHCPLDCTPRFITRKYAILRAHISSHHGLNIECEERTFLSLEEFASWKHYIEKQSVCSYIAQTAPKRLSFGQKKTYYVCHRSGRGRQASTGKRNIKFQGSCKVGTHCPSTLDLTEDEGKFRVRFYKTHAGHDLELVHLKLTRDERMDLADKISNGDSFSKILDDVQDELDNGDTLSRKHILSRKDLHNIKFELKNIISDDQIESAAPVIVNNAVSSIGNEEVKRKLNLMLELIENAKMNEESYSNLERTLDSSIKFVLENIIEVNAAETARSPAVIQVASPTKTTSRISDSRLNAFPYTENDVVRATSHIVNALHRPVQRGHFCNVSSTQDNVSLQACGNVPSSVVGTATCKGPLVLEGSRDKNIEATNSISDLHMNVFRCTRDRQAARDDSVFIPDTERATPVLLGKIRSGERIEVSSTIKDLHLNVTQCSRKRKPPRRLLPKTETVSDNARAIGAASEVKDLHLNVIRCSRKDRLFPGNDISFSEAEATEATAFDNSCDVANFETSNEISDLHLNVFRYTNENNPARYEAAASPEVSGATSGNVTAVNTLSTSKNGEAPERTVSDLYLNVIKCTNEQVLDNAGHCPDFKVAAATGLENVQEVFCGNVETATKKTNSTQLNVFRYTRKKKSAQENIITLRKRLRGSTSSIRVFALNDKDGKTLDMIDFDQVYGIDI